MTENTWLHFDLNILDKVDRVYLVKTKHYTGSLNQNIKSFVSQNEPTLFLTPTQSVDVTEGLKQGTMQVQSQFLHNLFYCFDHPSI